MMGEDRLFTAYSFAGNTESFPYFCTDCRKYVVLVSPFAGLLRVTVYIVHCSSLSSPGQSEDGPNHRQVQSRTRFLTLSFLPRFQALPPFNLTRRSRFDMVGAPTGLFLMHAVLHVLHPRRCRGDSSPWPPNCLR
jgi:hypothetical protein